jgi:exosortase/archaeosortase
VASTRGGARRAAKPKRRIQPRLVGLALASFAALVAWGALVWVAIHYGRSARGGDSGKWVHLAVASVGAVICLFICLWLLTKLLRRIGVLEDARPTQPHRH